MGPGIIIVSNMGRWLIIIRYSAVFGEIKVILVRYILSKRGMPTFTSASTFHCLDIFITFSVHRHYTSQLIALFTNNFTNAMI